MSFKFTLLGLETSNDRRCSTDTERKQNKMVKKKSSKKQIAQQKKFKKSVVFCHASTKTKEAFGKCLSNRLSKKSSKKRPKK